MSIIFVLIPIAIFLVCIAIGVFFWAVKSNQFDDLERHGSSILFDDDLPQKRHPSASAVQEIKQQPELNPTDKPTDKPKDE
jgi:cbb3-type cytochrome oxidase maturation protein